jgi:hypothetical protein
VRNPFLFSIEIAILISKELNKMERVRELHNDHHFFILIRSRINIFRYAVMEAQKRKEEFPKKKESKQKRQKMGFLRAVAGAEQILIRWT